MYVLLMRFYSCMLLSRSVVVIVVIFYNVLICIGKINAQVPPIRLCGGLSGINFVNGI